MVPSHLLRSKTQEIPLHHWSDPQSGKPVLVDELRFFTASFDWFNPLSQATIPTATTSTRFSISLAERAYITLILMRIPSSRLFSTSFRQNRFTIGRPAVPLQGTP